MKRAWGRVAWLLALALVAHPALAAAQTPSTTAASPDKAGRLRSLRAQVEEASAEEADLLDQLDDSTTRKREIDRRLAELNQQVGEVQPRLDSAQSRLSDLEAVQLGAEARLSEARQQLDAAKEVLQRRAIAAYMAPPAARYIGWILRVRTLRDVQAVGVYVNQALRTQQATVRGYDAAHRDVADRRNELVHARTDAAQARDLVSAERGRIEVQRQSELSLRQQAAAVVTEQQTALAKILARKRDFQSQIAALQRQSDALAAQLRSRQAGQPAPPVRAGILAYPIPGAPITDGFGPRTHPIYHDTRMHNGIDLGAAAGTPIQAAADGVVLSAGPFGGYGNATVIDHGNTLATLYAHQSTISVSAGSHVTRGQVIGHVGSTGLSTGPHLHFEVRKSGTPVDPMPYF